MVKLNTSKCILFYQINSFLCCFTKLKFVFYRIEETSVETEKRLNGWSEFLVEDDQKVKMVQEEVTTSIVENVKNEESTIEE